MAIVKFYSELKGFGFIERADGADLFFHVTALPEGADLPENGARVSFTVGANPRDGRPRAEDVRVIADRLGYAGSDRATT